VSLSAASSVPIYVRDRLLLALLSAAGIALVVDVVGISRGVRAPDGGGRGLFVSALVSAVTLVVLGLRPGAWLGARLLAFGAAAAALLAGLGQVAESPGAREAAFLGALGVLLLAGTTTGLVDAREHTSDGRVRLRADALVMATVVGGLVYLFGRWQGATDEFGRSVLLMVVVAGLAVAVVAVRGVLLVWCPTPVHAFLCVTSMVLASAAVYSTTAWDRPSGIGWPVLAEALAGIALLAQTAVVVLETRWTSPTPRPLHSLPWLQTGVMAAALLVAAISLPVAYFHRGPLGLVGIAILFDAVIVAVVLRLALDRIEMDQTEQGLERAIEARDRAMATMHAAAASITESESRLRLLLQSAVDGIVELDGGGRVVRANPAFCAMVDLPEHEMLGRGWADVAEQVRRTHPSFQAPPDPAGTVPEAAAQNGSLDDLPTTGHATLRLGERPVYLEARRSDLRVDGSPPGTLLLIRDVTSSRVAEQTIRTLFQFLQDRDEDRSRLLRRTAAAIEAERNRIARDLHDGPLQVLSGAGLSLEAVKLMVESDDPGRAAELLGYIVRELNDQSTELRRLMSDLRPPVLEERGLYPAVRELAGRLERETGIRTTVEEDGETEIPAEVQTLAYRVVQEALSNVAKHGEATEAAVRLQSKPGTIEVEVTDDGQGFDTTKIREFLSGGKVGLASMRERTELVGGTFVIRSSPGQGTTIGAMLPFEVVPGGSTYAR
jgi:signal transduction histidine kinase